MNSEETGRLRAETFREEHGLGSQPLGDIPALIEHICGVDVAILEVDNGDEHGMTAKDPARPRVAYIVAATSANPLRQRFTLMHEMSHYLFDDFVSDTTSPRPAEEKRADTFARHALAPLAGVKQLMRGRDAARLSDLSDLVQHFLVSPQVALIQLSEAGLISGGQKTGWWDVTAETLATKYGWVDRLDAMRQESLRARPPQRLLALATEGYRLDSTPVEMLARLRHKSTVDVLADLDAAGIAPEQARISIADMDDFPATGTDADDLSDLDDLDDANGGQHHAEGER